MNAHPTNLYEQLEPPERLTLLLEAMARDDAAEVERLQRSRPRVEYTGQDPAFEDRWTIAFDIMAVVCIDLPCMWGKLHVLRWALGVVREMATAQNITAAFAFLDGERCGKGQKQMGFFARPQARRSRGLQRRRRGGQGGGSQRRGAGQPNPVAVRPARDQTQHGHSAGQNPPA